MTNDQIARVAHEVNRAYQLGTNERLPSPAWEQAPDDQRASAVAGVVYARTHDTTPEQLHDAWVTQKAADGWTYGVEKDAAVKTHPCLVPYAQLPAVQRVKDRLFLAVVRTLTTTADETAKTAAAQQYVANYAAGTPIV